mgnify:CR=1 FL=1
MIGSLLAIECSQRTGGVALLDGNALARNLARHVAVDGRKDGFDAVARNVVERDVVTRQRADMRDAVAHLTGADDAHLAKLHNSNPWFRAAPGGLSICA